MNEPVQVEAAADKQGRLTPRRFTYAGQTYEVRHVGRRWENGPWEHTLVMSEDDQTWDLAHSAGSGAWRLMGHTAPRKASLI
jgi:hypothetical protein